MAGNIKIATQGEFDTHLKNFFVGDAPRRRLIDIECAYIKCDLTDLDILARTIYGEARGEDDFEKFAVGCVIRNRTVKALVYNAMYKRDHPKFGNGHAASACKMPQQFSCWNEGDPNLKVISEPELLLAPKLNDALKACWVAAYMVLMDATDVTQGSCHFHGKQISPAWAKDKTPVLETPAHRYYNDVA